jgi:hypothetical protein
VFFEAIFQPNRKSDYRADMKRLIGKPIPIQGGWISEEGSHKGEQCFYLATKNVSVIPASDLQNIRNISFVRWKEIHSKVQEEKDNKPQAKKAAAKTSAAKKPAAKKAAAKKPAEKKTTAKKAAAKKPAAKKPTTKKAAAKKPTAKKPTAKKTDVKKPAAKKTAAKKPAAKKTAAAKPAAKKSAAKKIQAKASSAKKKKSAKRLSP